MIKFNHKMDEDSAFVEWNDVLEYKVCYFSTSLPMDVLYYRAVIKVTSVLDPKVIG